MLILLAAFNNLVGGVFLALMDAYGLTLVSVETWGFLFGFISLAFILGELIVARVGLGAVPVRVVLIGNMVNWFICGRRLDRWLVRHRSRARPGAHLHVGRPRRPAGDRGGPRLSLVPPAGCRYPGGLTIVTG